MANGDSRQLAGDIARSRRQVMGPSQFVMRGPEPERISPVDVLLALIERSGVGPLLASGAAGQAISPVASAEDLARSRRIQEEIGGLFAGASRALELEDPARSRDLDVFTVAPFGGAAGGPAAMSAAGAAFRRAIKLGRSSGGRRILRKTTGIPHPTFEEHLSTFGAPDVASAPQAGVVGVPDVAVENATESFHLLNSVGIINDDLVKAGLLSPEAADAAVDFGGNLPVVNEAVRVGDEIYTLFDAAHLDEQVRKELDDFYSFNNVPAPDLRPSDDPRRFPLDTATLVRGRRRGSVRDLPSRVRPGRTIFSAVIPSESEVLSKAEIRAVLEERGVGTEKGILPDTFPRGRAAGFKMSIVDAIERGSFGPDAQRKLAENIAAGIRGRPTDVDFGVVNVDGNFLSIDDIKILEDLDVITTEVTGSLPSEIGAGLSPDDLTRRANQLQEEMDLLLEQTRPKGKGVLRPRFGMGGRSTTADVPRGASRVLLKEPHGLTEAERLLFEEEIAHALDLEHQLGRRLEAIEARRDLIVRELDRIGHPLESAKPQKRPSRRPRRP